MAAACEARLSNECGEVADHDYPENLTNELCPRKQDCQGSGTFSLGGHVSKGASNRAEVWQTQSVANGPKQWDEPTTPKEARSSDHPRFRPAQQLIGVHRRPTTDESAPCIHNQLRSCRRLIASSNPSGPGKDSTAEIVKALGSVESRYAPTNQLESVALAMRFD